MLLRHGTRMFRAAGLSVTRVMLAAVCASALAACKQDGATGTAMAPRGATVAFDVIDGLPPAQFATLVRNLNDEAQSRRMAVLSREATTAYRVRGSLTATIDKGRTTIAWVWDVVDRESQTALRIAGEETAKEPTRDVNTAWNVADDAMLRRIAASSMDQLAAFLTSPEVAPATAAQVSFVQDSSPEAAGIYRIYRPEADPVAAGGVSVPLPQRKPGTQLSARGPSGAAERAVVTALAEPR